VLVIVIGTGVFQNAVSLLQLVLAARELSGNRPEPRMNLLWRRYAEISPPISLLVPAYNEELSIVESLRSMLALNYPNFEILAINDGSKDGTLQAVIDGFGLEPVVRPYEDAVLHKPIRGLYGSPRYPNLLLIDKENGGKSDALNAGINLSRAPIFCAIELNPRERCALARRAALHRRTDPHGRGRRHDPHRERMPDRERARHAHRPAAKHPRPVPDGRIPARLP
jgi:glycosyltransferase involved in cell wall biosynthesis